MAKKEARGQEKSIRLDRKAGQEKKCLHFYLKLAAMSSNINVCTSILAPFESVPVPFSKVFFYLHGLARSVGLWPFLKW